MLRTSAIWFLNDPQVSASALSVGTGPLTRRFGGVGLGLAICRGLVDLMQGEISAQGRPGEGAVFRVELPMPAQAARAA